MFLIEEFIAVLILALLFCAGLFLVSWLMVVHQEVEWLGRASVRLATEARHLADSLWQSVVTR